ncbi:10635_t:CDS:2, partial [Acaulospora morrowiae]
FRRLSELTGNPIYLHKAQKVLDVIQSKKTSLPGLYPIFIDPYRGRFGKDWISWGAYGDSFYEYLLKQYIMVRETVPQYIDMWKLAVNSTIENLVVSARGFPELQYLAQWKNNKLIFGMEHLACFSGGNFILGARTLNDQSLLDLGLSLTSTCYNTYLGTGTQLGPEQFGWDQPIGYTNFPQNRQFQELGYFVTNSKYPLRPEVVE